MTNQASGNVPQYVWMVYIHDNSDTDKRYGPDMLAAVCASEDVAKRTIEEIEDSMGILPNFEYYYQERAVVQ